MSVREDSRQSGLGIRRLKAKLHDSASRADVLSHDRGDLQVRLEDIKNKNIPHDQSNSDTLATHLFILLLIPAVYFVDFLLFGPTAEILAEKVFYDMPRMTWAARLIVPALIIIIEMTLAMLIFSTKNDAESYHGSKGAYWGWLTAGIFFALVMPSLVVGTNLAQMSFEKETVQKAIHWQLIGLVTFASITHILIIFSGRLAHEAKAFLIYKAQHGSLERRIKQCTISYDREARTFRRDFDSFYELLNRHRNTFQDNFDSGPFDNVTRNFARTVYGYDVIQPASPDQGSANINLEHQTPINNQAFDENNETDPRVRDEESEVKL